MVKLSSYSNGYDDSNYRLTPWEFWTEEEKSLVINKAYEGHYLTSKEVKKYLDVSRRHMFTQFIVPVLSGVTYFGLLKNSLLQGLYRKSPYYGLAGGIAFVAVTTIWWVNESPFYKAKEQSQEKLLDYLYHKMGTSMKLLNDALPRTRTSVEMDRRTRKLYDERNGQFAGTLYAEDDFAPPIISKNKTHVYKNKKIYL